MFGPVVVRRYVTLENLAKNNEVAGFKFAVVGVLYAVLLAFAIIVVWERFSDAENGVVKVKPHALSEVLEDFGSPPGDH
jgi:hypothetical protein